MLGCEHSEHREYARDQLLSMGPVAIPPLAWGRRHKDRHVAHMCEIMLDAFCPCNLCEGTGYLHNRRWDSRTQLLTPVSWACYHCGGDGSVR